MFLFGKNFFLVKRSFSRFCSKGQVIVQANGGDQNLGGNNFDDVLMEMIKEELYTIIKDEGALDENYYEKPTGRRVTEKQKRDYKMRMSNLRKVAEEVKIKLSEQRAYRVKMK